MFRGGGVATHVVASTVVSHQHDHGPLGCHGPGGWSGSLLGTFRVRRQDVLSESRMR